MIEHLGHGLAQVERARPVEIAEDRPRARGGEDGLQTRDLLAHLAPFAAVEDEPVDAAPELLARLRAQLALPPEVERQIGVEIRIQHIRDHLLRAAVDDERDLLAADRLRALAGEMAVRIDPRPHRRRARLIEARDENGAAGMLAREVGKDARILLQPLRARAEDGEIDERSAGLRAAGAFPELLQFAGDLAKVDGLAEGGGIECHEKSVLALPARVESRKAG